MNNFFSPEVQKFESENHELLSHSWMESGLSSYRDYVCRAYEKKEYGFKAIENNIPEMVKKIKEAEEKKCAATAPMIFIAVGIVVAVALMVLFSSCGAKDTRSYVEREYPHMWDQRDAADSSLNADVQAIEAKYNVLKK